jgi:hypothetical protein
MRMIRTRIHRPPGRARARVIAWLSRCHRPAAYLPETLAYRGSAWYQLRRGTHGAVPALERRREPPERLGRQMILLGRGQAYATARRYPIRRRRDVLAALRHEPGLIPYPGGQELRHRLVDGNGTTLNLWYLPDRGAHFARPPALIVPEEWLIARAEPEHRFWRVEAPDGAYFLYRHPDGQLVSQACVAPFADTDTFLAAVGGAPPSGGPRVLDATAWPRVLAEGLARLDWWDLIGFYGGANPLRRRRIDLNRLRRPALVGGSLLLAYALLSSYLIEARLDRLRHEAQAQRAERVAALRQEEALVAAEQTYARLSTPLRDYTLRSRYLRVFAELLAPSWTVNRLTVDSTGLEFRAQAPSATAVLSTVSQHPAVAEAAFAAPVEAARGQANAEAFTIRLQLDDPPGGSAGTGTRAAQGATESPKAQADDA